MRQVSGLLLTDYSATATSAQADQHPVSYRSVRPFRSNTCRRTVEEAKGRSGSDCDSPRFENMARKLPVKFRLLEAAGRHWILTTQSRHCRHNTLKPKRSLLLMS